LRDRAVFPHKSSQFIEGIGLSNGASLNPEYGYFGISIVAPGEKDAFNPELNIVTKRNFLVEYPVATMGCGTEDSKVKVSSLFALILFRKNGIVS
jgi:hypothetical protein